MSIAAMTLALPEAASRAEKLGWTRFCSAVGEMYGKLTSEDSFDTWLTSAGLTQRDDRPMLEAACRVAVDLLNQGWTVAWTSKGAIFSPPDVEPDSMMEKSRIRRQELVRRDEQLRAPSVRKFVRSMEAPRLFRGDVRSVFDLMADGAQLADRLSAAAQAHDGDVTGVVRPYVQVVDDSVCEFTGLRLTDIWRYFRHTWSSSYSTTPGRTLPLLVRDAGTEHHCVIGLAALASPVVQIAERDHWIGWDTDSFVAGVRSEPTAKVARWVRRRLAEQVKAVYADDLIEQGVILPSDLISPTPEAIASLKSDSLHFKRRHHTFGRRKVSADSSAASWVTRAETDLFRSKRSATLAEALENLSTIEPFLAQGATAASIRRLLATPAGTASFRRLVRRARGERVGTVVADLSVCGALPPYSSLVAGKLVAALATSPTVIREYHARYSRPSEIASSMAGAPTTRDARLALVTTSSLYGSGSSQYNRLYWPSAVLGGVSGTRLGFEPIGRSRSFGSSHFADETVAALARVAAIYGSEIRVSGLFGEGVSPRLRKVRLGLAALNWPSNDLLRHGRQRLLYAAPLVENLREFALGIDRNPAYLFDLDTEDDVDRLSEWWTSRWASMRLTNPQVVAEMRANRVERPVDHQARVRLPTLETEDDARLLW